MRNTAQYPITREEKLLALDWAIEHALQQAEAEQSMGDITALALQEARKDIAAANG